MLIFLKSQNGISYTPNTVFANVGDVIGEISGPSGSGTVRTGQLLIESQSSFSIPSITQLPEQHSANHVFPTKIVSQVGLAFGAVFAQSLLSRMMYEINIPTRLRPLIDEIIASKIFPSNQRHGACLFLLFCPRSMLRWNGWSYQSGS
jgi:hypothetical protein